MAGMGRHRAQAGDIMLEPPTVRQPAAPPVAEDQTYVGFIAGALLIAIAAGFLLATVVPLTTVGTLPGIERLPRLIQAHGWAQLQGWSGLFVAGMAIRIVPRFAGRHPIPGRITLPILICLVASVVLRTIIEPWGEGRSGELLLILAGVLGGLGMAAITSILAITLIRGRRQHAPWEIFIAAGTGWWAAWAIYTPIVAIRAADNRLLTPATLDDAMTWLVMFGAVGNFIWGIQSRSVRVFFGRRLLTQREVLLPAIALNLGPALIMLSLATWEPATGARIEGAGLLLAGGATAVLAPLTGSIWGKAHRLRPRARSASRFVLAANWAAVIAGLLLVWAGASTLVQGEFAAINARDAARHAYGVGLITMLILGMAQLIAPMFAASRTEATQPPLTMRLPFWLLLAATTLRIGAGLVEGNDALQPEAWLHTMALAGTLAWLALILFAVSVIRAFRTEQRLKAQRPPQPIRSA